MDIANQIEQQCVDCDDYSKGIFRFHKDIAAAIIDIALAEAINERDKAWKIAAQRKGKSALPDMMAALALPPTQQGSE